MIVALRLLSMLLALAMPAHAGERCLAIDGDTLVCQKRKVRLINIHAAELDQPGGRVAKHRLQALIRSGELTLKAYGRDHYGRILAEAYVNGRRIEQSDVGPRGGRGR